MIILGVLLLVAGMGLYTYQVTIGGGVGGLVFISYPYQTLGLILLAAGIVSVGLGCLGFHIPEMRKWKAESIVPKQSS